MRDPQARTTSSDLHGIVGDGIAALRRFDELLASERHALEARDPAALERASAGKTDCLGTLEDLERSRQARCTEAGYAADAMADCLAWCDPDGSLSAAWQRYLDLATRCSSANQTNGAIIRGRLRQISTALSTLCGEPGDTTYGPGGRAGGHTSRAIAEA